METMKLEQLTEQELKTLLQKKIFQLGVNGLQQNDLLRVINSIEVELGRRKEKDISQAKLKKVDTITQEDTEQSKKEDNND